MQGLFRLCCATLLLLSVSAGWSQFVPLQWHNAFSPRNASYTIDVRLDPDNRALRGEQVLTWRNLQSRPAGELWFHLYWNAWRNNRSSWMRGAATRWPGRFDDVRPEDWGYIEVDAVRLLPENGPPVDLTERMRFAAPDDGNPDDRTVLVVPLPEPVAAGQTVRVEIVWNARIPRTFRRTGYRGDYYFLAHWFPKLGVHEPQGWNCHQFHAATEFYSDYGNYDVSMTVPGEHVVGATGRETERRENDDGTVTHRYYQEDVHAFTWTSSPHYAVREKTFDEPGLPQVSMRLLIQPEHLQQVERHFAATGAALKHFGTWFGPYDYGHLTIVDPAYGSGAGGMEYPTLFTCGTRLLNPVGGDAPESVTVHEAGHQFWYGLVGNNEFEHAWIDEGLNTFSTLRTLDVAYGDRVLVRRYLLPPGETEAREGFIPLRFPDIKVSRWQDRLDRYRPSARADDPSTPTYRYYPETAADITYSKTALWLATLERHLGWPTLQRIMSTFFNRQRFGHPTPQDFLAVANEVTGRDVSWFFDQVYRGSAVFDYAVHSVSSEPLTLDGFEEQDGRLVYRKIEPQVDAAGTIFRTEVVVQRLGGGFFPVDILLVFEDGYELRQSWDGEDRWKQIVEERESRLAHAVIDPERKLMLDLHYTNNSMLREPAAALPARKWASRWMIWMQDLMATFAFFI